MDRSSGGNLWFVYRDVYCGPFAKHLSRLPDPTVWHWLTRLRAVEDPDALAPADLHERLVTELGGDFYGFGLLGLAATPDSDRRAGLGWATTEKEVRDLLDEHVYVVDLRVDEHSIRMYTNDGGRDMAWFVLDDQLARARPDRAAFLLHDGPFPATPASVPAGPPFVAEVPPADTYRLGDGPGTTYVVDLAVGASSDVFDDMDHLRLDGIRLPALRAALADPDELPDDAREALEEFLDDYGMGDLIQKVLDGAADAHVASSDDVVLFDDRWAAAHPVLAASLLRYVHDWDPFD